MTARGALTRARAIHIEDALGRRNVRLSGKTHERSGPCPKCGGEDRFSVHLEKQVFNCRGCGAKGHGAIDLVMFLDGCAFPAAVETLTGERPERAAESKQSFDYHDENGRLLYQVERIDLNGFKDGKRNKKFIQRRPNGNGGWISDLDGVRRVPYRLPELIEAAANGNLIVIVEGERKVDLLWSWNVPATCNSGGYGSLKIWAEHADYFHDANVTILPDNDDAGRKHANAVAAFLKKVDARVRIIDLPGLPPKGDIVDWAAAGGTAETLQDLIENSSADLSEGVSLDDFNAYMPAHSYIFTPSREMWPVNKRQWTNSAGSAFG